MVKNPPAVQETWVQSLGREDPLEKGMATHSVFLGFPCGSAGKESTCSAGDLGSIPGLGRSTGEGNSYPLQYSGLENAVDSIVDGVTKSGTQPSNFHFTAQLLSEFLEAPYIFLFLNGRILGGITVFYV